MIPLPYILGTAKGRGKGKLGKNRGTELETGGGDKSTNIATVDAGGGAQTALGTSGLFIQSMPRE